MRLISLALAFALIVGMLASSVCFASKADEMLSKAAEATQRAREAKTGSIRDSNYKKALETYGKVARQSDGMPQGAEAMYRIAEIMSSAKGKTKNERGAYDDLTKLLNVYDKAPQVLEENLTQTELHQVQRTVAQAKKLRQSIASEMSRQNSKGYYYKIMDFFVALTGRVPAFSYWFAIILVTLIVKVIITPLTKAQFKAMKEMQRIAPLVKDIQEKHKGDQKAIGEKTMALYKEHSVNPFASCLPLLVQFPILILLYTMIRSYEFEFQKATFLWIGSGLSHMMSFPVPFNQGQLVWFTAANLAEPDLILVVLYVISMYISTKLSSVDPTQAEQQKMMAIMMPLMFAFIFAGFPAAFLLYWLVFNILQTTQQYMILRPAHDEAIVPAPTPPAPEKGEQTSGETARVRRRKRR